MKGAVAGLDEEQQERVNSLVETITKQVENLNSVEDGLGDIGLAIVALQKAD